VDAALLEHHWRAAHLPGAHVALAAWITGRLDLRVGDLLPRLAAPVWLGWGRASRRPPVEAADLWLRRLPAADLEVFAGSGALPHAEEPTAFVAALGRWIAARSSAARGR
jgi:pimeloyl-ACP methyl ester carboxylesterase